MPRFLAVYTGTATAREKSDAVEVMPCLEMPRAG